MDNKDIRKINILGQWYSLERLTTEEFPKLKNLNADGLAELYSKRIIINKEIEDDANVFENIDGYIDKVIRHEIIHAFFHESGLDEYGRDETLVDWLANQIPKINKVIESI